MAYKPAIGDKVTCVNRVESYDSKTLKRSPKTWFEPGNVGSVAAINCPSVWQERVSFTCVDFIVNGKRERVALFNDNIVKIDG